MAGLALVTENIKLTNENEKLKQANRELQAQNARLREIAGELAEGWQERYECHSSYMGDGTRCQHCSDYYMPDVVSEKYQPREHAHDCPVARLQREGEWLSAQVDRVAALEATLQSLVDEIRLADLYNMDRGVVERVRALGIKVGIG